MRRFTSQEIERMRLMVQCGYDGKSIGVALQRPPQAIRVKACELGLKLKPQSVAHRRVRLPVSTWQKLKVAADAYNLTVVKLNAMLIETIVRDGLVGAVLDCPPARPKPTATPRPLIISTPSPPPQLDLTAFQPHLFGRA